MILAEATEAGLTQRDCVISPGQREAHAKAEEGRERPTQRSRGVTQWLRELFLL